MWLVGLTPNKEKPPEKKKQKKSVCIHSDILTINCGANNWNKRRNTTIAEDPN